MPLEKLNNHTRTMYYVLFVITVISVTIIVSNYFPNINFIIKPQKTKDLLDFSRTFVSFWLHFTWCKRPLWFFNIFFCVLVTTTRRVAKEHLDYPRSFEPLTTYHSRRITKERSDYPRYLYLQQQIFSLQVTKEHLDNPRSLLYLLAVDHQAIWFENKILYFTRTHKFRIINFTSIIAIYPSQLFCQMT